MIHPIVLYGDPVLKKKGKNISADDLDVKAIAEDMFETMHNASGVGLAAPQIGKSIRLFVVDSSPLEEKKEDGVRQIFINPEIIEESGEEWVFEEGCLSIPGIRENVSRQPRVRIKYFDENWVAHDKVYDSMIARVIQHEYDHIEGILFTDHLTSFKKRLLKSKLTNISKGKVDADYRVKIPAKR